MKIAVIGGGGAGTVAAWGLSQKHKVTLYEKEAKLGGHVNSFTTDCFEKNHTFDVGFTVFTNESYPVFTALLKRFGIKTSRAKSSISIFGGKTFPVCENIKELLLANKLWMLDPRVAWLAMCILRFNKIANRDLDNNNIPDCTIVEYLKKRGFNDRFFYNYLGAAGSAIWVGTPETVATTPAESFLKFFRHHKLLGFRRHVWQTVVGGSMQYINALENEMPGTAKTDCAAAKVERLKKGIKVTDVNGKSATYDQVVFACHPDTTLEVLASPSTLENELLGTFAFAPNHSFCHRDETLLPPNKGLWSSWNCFYQHDGNGGQKLSVSYFLNCIHKVDRSDPVFLTTNPHTLPKPELVFSEHVWSHLQYTDKSIAAQKRMNEIQGKDRIWYAGGWMGFGFHEDAVGSGLTIARALGCKFPELPKWERPDW